MNVPRNRAKHDTVQSQLSQYMTPALGPISLNVAPVQQFWQGVCVRETRRGVFSISNVAVCDWFSGKVLFLTGEMLGKKDGAFAHSCRYFGCQD